jgi:hypothetical protein
MHHHTCPAIHHSIEHIFVCLSRVSSRPGTQRPSHSVRCARLKVLWCTLQCPAVPCSALLPTLLFLYCAVLCCARRLPTLCGQPVTLWTTLSSSYPCCPMLPHAAHALHPHDHAALSARAFPSGPRFPLLTMLSMLSMLSFVVHAAARSCCPRCPCRWLWAL